MILYLVISASKKTLNFSSGVLEDAKDKAFEVLKIRESRTYGMTVFKMRVTQYLAFPKRH